MWSVTQMTGVTAKRLTGCLLVLLVLSGRSVAQSNDQGAPKTQTDVELRADVLEWVDQLDAPSLSARKAAEQSLIEAGPAALQFIPAAKPGTSVEAAERLARVREALLAMRTETAAKPDQTVIRLGNVATLEAALEAISRDSGVEFEFAGDSSVAVEPVNTPLTFWHAVDLVLDQTNLDIDFYGGDRQTLLLVPRAAERPSRVDSAAYAGVYRIEPTLVTSRRHLTQAAMSGLNVNVEISWQPTLTPIGLTIPVKQLAGQLDDEQPLRPQESGESIDVATNSDIAFSEFYLPMKLPAGRPQKISSIAGVIRALMPGTQRTFELPLAEDNPSLKIDAMTVAIEERRASGPLFQVRVAVELENPDRSLESHRHWIFENDVHVKRKDGSRADHLGFEVYRQTASGVGIGYLFDLGESVDDSVLVYRSPTAVVPNEVPFVIQDIPLP